MKKIILFITFILFSIYGYSQDIYLDKWVNDSTHWVFGKGICKHKFTDTVTWTYCIGVEQINGINNYMIGVCLNSSIKPIEFPNNTTLLIKTVNGDVLELHSIYNNTENKKIIVENEKTVVNTQVISKGNHTSYNSTIRNVPENSIKYTTNTITCNISKEDINKLNDGIIKVRIENKLSDIGYIEKEYNKDKVGKLLYNQYLKINTLLNTSNKHSIKDNF